MYLCENCHQGISATIPSHLITTQTRQKTYPFRTKANHYKDSEGKRKISDDPGGNGQEIVKQQRVCPDCFKQLTK